MSKKEWVMRNGDNYSAEIIETVHPMVSLIHGFTTRINAVALPFGYLAIFGVIIAAFYHGDRDWSPTALVNVPLSLLSVVSSGSSITAPICGLGTPAIFAEPLLPSGPSHHADASSPSTAVGDAAVATRTGNGWIAVLTSQDGTRREGSIGVLTYCRAGSMR